jgi:hypothetical protein
MEINRPPLNENRAAHWITRFIDSFQYLFFRDFPFARLDHGAPGSRPFFAR